MPTAAGTSIFHKLSTRLWATMKPPLLLINERHQVQFPSDVEVIYIAPPALDEFAGVVQNWAEQRQAEMSRMADGGGQVEAENSSEDNGDSAPDS